MPDRLWGEQNDAASGAADPAAGGPKPPPRARGGLLRRPSPLITAAAQMRRRLTYGYMLALIVLAVLTLSGSLILSNLVMRQSDAAAVINRAGAQRMLSQRIAALVVDAAGLEGASKQQSLNDLEAAAAQMRVSHEALTIGDHAAARRTAALEALYFGGPAPLDSMVRRFLAEVDSVSLAIRAARGADPAAIAAVRDQALGPLLARLHQAVALHEAAAKRGVGQAIAFHWAVVAATLLVLVAEVFLIFRPLAREVFVLADGLDREARRDMLTGLLNRRAMGEALTEVAASGSAVAVIAIDLDHFKEVNDAEGHAAGDALLRAAAARLPLAVRAGDLIARIGGDEFAVFLVGVGDHYTANDVAVRIRDSLHQSVQYGSRTLRLGATLGVAIVPQDADSAEAGMRAADDALVRVKLTERGGIGWASRQDSERVARVAAILRAFDAAGPLGELAGLSAHFQPIVSLSGPPVGPPRLVALEALTRWHHPSLGDIPPAELIDAIGPERTARLGRAVRDDALRGFAALRPALPAGVRVGLNLSASEVARRDMVAQIGDQVQAAGLTLQDVAIEITEQVLLERVSTRIIDQLTNLRDRGARLVLDDFGTGNAGLAQLLRLNLDAVKLDRRFIHGLGDNERADAIVRATLSLAHGLGLEVIAEGVETVQQSAILRRLGCDAAQGYLFARPMDSGALRGWVEAA
jgi:diguanylate cyclase (GGDEF)-like protein